MATADLVILARGPLPPGPAGTRRTLELMQRVAIAGSDDVNVRAAAAQILAAARVHAGDVAGAIRVLFQFVRDRVRFQPDPRNVELLRTPSRSLSERAGDCDDKAILLASLLRAASLPLSIRFRAVAARRRTPNEYSHVFVVVTFAGRQLALDATLPWMQLGWSAPSVLRPMEIAL